MNPVSMQRHRERKAPVFGCIFAAALCLGQPQSVPLIGADEVTLTAAAFQLEPVFHAGTNTIQVDVHVFDRDGLPVPGLTVNDFRLLDNGSPQTITNFTAIENEAAGASPKAKAGAAANCAPLASPVAVMFYFDDIATEFDGLAYSREKALAYLDARQCGGRLPEGFHAGVVTVSGYDDQPITEDETKLRNAMRAIAPHPHSSSKSVCPYMTPYQAWEIIRFTEDDATKLAIAQASKCGACNGQQCPSYVKSRAEDVWGEAETTTQMTLASLMNTVAVLGHQPERRTLILTSSGFLTQSELDRQKQKLIDFAIRSNVTIDALDARGLVAPTTATTDTWNDPFISPTVNGWRTSEDAGGFSPRDSAMWEIAESTGGEFFHDNNDLQRAYQQGVEGPRVYYSLVFSRPDLVPDGTFHNLKVTLAQAGSYDIQARPGYYAPSSPPVQIASLEPPAANDALHQTLANAVRGPEVAGPVELLLEAQAEPGAIHLVLRINPNTLALSLANGRHAGHLDLVFALLNDDGGFVTGSEAKMDVNLTDSSWRSVTSPGVGLGTGTSLTAAPGHYRARVVLFEPSSGKLRVVDRPVIIEP